MTVKISNINIGNNHPTFVIAELSANHNQSFDLAIKSLEAAKAAGADAIKLQTYTPDTITINCNNKFFQINQDTLWDGKTLYELYKEAYTPWEWQPKLKKIADDIGLICFSSPFDITAVDFLEKMQVSAYKIASFEITDTPLIEYTAAKGKPIIISTGIAALEEIDEAVQACKKVGNQDIILLKCVSDYPAQLEAMNLKNILFLQERYKTIVGLSDHSIGSLAAITAVSLGAKIIEKHFILDKNMGGPDAPFSAEPKEFKLMVDSIRQVEKALGSKEYKSTEKMKEAKIFSRSLFVTKDMKKGDIFTLENFRSIRPGYGLPPKYFGEILGKKAAKSILQGTPLEWKMIEK